LNKNLLNFLQDCVGDVKDVVTLKNQGCTSLVNKVTTISGDSYILKSAEKTIYQEWLKDEAATLLALNNQHEIPVPSYYGFTQLNNQSHLLMSYEIGETLAQLLSRSIGEHEKYKLIESFGCLLNKLHRVNTENQILNSPNDWLENQLKKAERYLNFEETEGDKELLEFLKENKPESTQKTYIHGDSTVDNVLVNNGEVYMFIDVAALTIGDPRYDEALAIRKFLNNKEYLTSFYKGYTRYKINKNEFNYFCNGLYEFF
jgi:aminoglycoside phosphotransferase (APT) family kinase protein